MTNTYVFVCMCVCVHSLRIRLNVAIVTIVGIHNHIGILKSECRFNPHNARVFRLKRNAKWGSIPMNFVMMAAGISLMFVMIRHMYTLPKYIKHSALPLVF